MSDEILLYLVLFGMLMLAIGMLMPSLLRIGRSSDMRAEEDEAYGEAVIDAFRRQQVALDEERRTGAITEARWEELSDDLRRRMLEEHDAVFHDPNASEAPTQPNQTHRVSGPLVTGLVVTGMVAVSVGLYAAQGAPELIELEKAQHVLSGEASTPDIERYLENSPKDGRAWVLLAHRYVEAEAYPKALDAYRNARQVNTKVAADPSVMLEMAATLVTVGGLAHRYVEAEAYPKALDAYRNARQVNTKVAADPSVMLEMAATLVTVGGHDNFKEAQPLVEKALEKLPGDKRALELLALTSSANQDWKATLVTVGGHDNFKEAQPLVEKALEKLPGDKRALELLALTSSANQDWKTAANTLALLLEGMSPDTPAYMRYEQTLKRLRELAAQEEIQAKQ